MRTLQLPRWMKENRFLYSDEQMEKLFLLFLFCWMILWTLLPSLAVDTYFVDVAENIVWGTHFQFGYDKNPPLGAWITHFFHVITGGSLRVHFLLSQLCVGTAFFAVWRIAGKVVSKPAAFLSTIALFAINFYGMKAVEFCDDVMEHAAWSLLLLFFYKALTEEKNRTLNWCISGILAAASLMIKYLAPALFLPMLLVMLFTKEGRTAFRHKGVWLALIIFLLLISGNVVWLFRNDFTPIHYAADRSDLSGTIRWMDHFDNPWRAFHRALGVFVFPIIIFALCFFCRTRENGCRLSGAWTRFNTVFLTLAAWGPFAGILLFSAVTGANINYSWLQPFFLFVPLCFFYFWNPVVSTLKFRLFTGCMIIFAILFGTIFFIRTLEYQAYRKRGCDTENFPGLPAASAIGSQWRNTFGGKVPYVVGSRICCSCFAIASKGTEPLFEGNLRHSQWIRKDDLLRKGCVLVWENEDKAQPRYIAEFRKNYGNRMSPVMSFTIPRAVPGWYRKLRGTPKTVQISYCFLYPEKP